jgi:hypothetical protein
MADDAGISKELKTQLQESIDGLFDKIIDSYTSTLEPPKTEKLDDDEIKRKRDAYKKELVEKLKTAYEEKISKDTGKQFENILSGTLSNRENIKQDIGSVCKFVENIEIKLTGNKKIKYFNIREAKHIINITLTFSLTPIGYEIDNKIVNKELYCLGKSLFDHLFATFTDSESYFFNFFSSSVNVHYTIRLERGDLSKDSLYYKNAIKCYESKASQASQASQGGSKSRRIRRRKHARKTHHKRASKSHKRRRHSRVARKHKKHTRR